MAIERWVIAPGQTKVIDIEMVGALKVSLIGGRVNVIAHDEPGARVEVNSVSGKDLLVEIDGDTLTVDHPQLRWDNWIEAFRGFRGSAKTEVSILVPRTAQLKLGVVSAAALVAGMETNAKLNTVSGEIVADSMVGDLDLNSVSGELSVGHHTGKLKVNTVSGDVTATGNIRRFTADGVTGNMIVDADGVPEMVTTNTVSGDLTLRMRLGRGARYRVNTVSGSIQLDDVSIRGSLGKGFERSVGELDGSDWLDLQANSVSGDVSVVSRSQAEDAAESAANANAEASE